jgi:hypothetical protein
MPVPFTVPYEFANAASIVAAEHNSNWDAIEQYVELLSAGTNLDTGSITTAKIADANVTTAKITDGNVTLAKLATAVQNLLVPAGTITATIKSTADTGYLLLNGSTITGAEALYPALFAVAPTSWRTGTAPNRNLVLPNMANKLIGGVGTIALGALGGDNTILEANLPSHDHTLASHTHTLAHTHQVNPPNTTSGTEVESPGTSEVVYNTNSYIAAGTDYRAVDQSLDPITFGMSVRDTSDGNTHTHAVDIAAFTSGAASATTTSGPNVTNTGNTGGGTDLRVEQLAVNFQIKAH